MRFLPILVRFLICIVAKSCTYKRGYALYFKENLGFFSVIEKERENKTKIKSLVFFNIMLFLAAFDDKPFTTVLPHRFNK